MSFGPKCHRTHSHPAGRRLPPQTTMPAQVVSGTLSDGGIHLWDMWLGMFPQCRLVSGGCPPQEGCICCSRGRLRGDMAPDFCQHAQRQSWRWLPLSSPHLRIRRPSQRRVDMLCGGGHSGAQQATARRLFAPSRSRALDTRWNNWCMQRLRRVRCLHSLRSLLIRGFVWVPRRMATRRYIPKRVRRLGNMHEDVLIHDVAATKMLPRMSWFKPRQHWVWVYVVGSPCTSGTSSRT